MGKTFKDRKNYEPYRGCKRRKKYTSPAYEEEALFKRNRAVRYAKEEEEKEYLEDESTD